MATGSERSKGSGSSIKGTTSAKKRGSKVKDRAAKVKSFVDKKNKELKGKVPF